LNWLVFRFINLCRFNCVPDSVQTIELDLRRNLDLQSWWSWTPSHRTLGPTPLSSQTNSAKINNCRLSLWKVSAITHNFIMHSKPKHMR